MVYVIPGLHDQFTSRHSVLLSMFFGPLGLLSHLVTQVSKMHFTGFHLLCDASLSIHLCNTHYFKGVSDTILQITQGAVAAEQIN